MIGMKNLFADTKRKELSKHFRNGFYRNTNYIVNIIENISGSGRDNNGVAVLGVQLKDRYNSRKWKITIQIAYVYCLNDKVGDEYIPEKESRVVSSKFLPLYYKRLDYKYSKIKLDNSFIKQTFVKILTTHFDHKLKDSGYFICASTHL